MTTDFLRIPKEDIDIIQQQITKQQKVLIGSLLAYIATFFLVIARTNGHMPQLYFYIISIPSYIKFFYSPINKAIITGRLIFKLHFFDNDEVEITTFGTLWRDDKTRLLNLNDLGIEKNAYHKLFLGRYELHTVYIDRHRLYIFSTLIVTEMLKFTQNL